MLDFGRADFDKAIRTSVQKKVEIVSKYPLVKLADVTEILSGGTPSTNNAEYWDNGTIFWATLVDTKEKYLTKTERKITEKGLNSSSAKLLPVNTVIFSSRATIGDVTIAKVETATNQGYKNFICNPNAINYEYLYYILKQQAKNIESLASGMTYKEISKTEIGNFKIPLPPLDIQQKIVEECQKIDDEFNRTRMKIEEYRAKIANIFNDLEVIQAGGVKWFKINELCRLKGISLNPQEHYGSVNYLSLENIEGNTGKIIGNYVHEYQSIQSIKNVFEIGDILYGKLRPNLNKVYLAEIDGICSTDILVLTADEEKIDAGLLSHYLRSRKFNR